MEDLKCRKCGARFAQERVDDALRDRALICPFCLRLLTEADLGPRDWLQREGAEIKLQAGMFGALAVALTVVSAPKAALAVAFFGALCVCVIRIARKGERPPGPTDRKSSR
jgi:hypothetical protein